MPDSNPPTPEGHCLDLKVEYRLLESLKPYSGNARTHSQRQVAQIAASIRRFGFVSPVLLGEDDVVIAGHGRIEAARSLAMAEVPTIRLEHLSPAERRAYLLADNRLAELAGWDTDLLALELKGLEALDLDFELELTGFEGAELERLLGPGTDAADDPQDQVPEATGPAVTRPGDVWVLGPHRLHCGDARDPQAYDTLMAGELARMVFADPPYNVAIDGHAGGKGRIARRPFIMASGEMSSEEFTTFLTETLSGMAGASTDGAIAFICMDWRHLPELLAAGAVAYDEMKNLIVWTKDNGGMGAFYRHPKPKGQPAEPLLTFPGGALVHFAVSNSEVEMTTRLDGPATRFLPFNQGDHGAKGNPSGTGGHPTAYLWEQVWQRDSWLEILGRYLVTKRDTKKAITGVIFPRYHQLDATRKLTAKVLEEGPGGRFLIQHSAGSGKTNSIAWSAHFLSELHDADDNKLFSSVIVVSDRNVIDSQLQEALFDFQRTTGVVETIKSDGGSKSGQLAKALADGKKVIVCTIQTFPFALEAVQELAATEGKAFAVIADEAHSSQTGEAASKLKELLSAAEVADLVDGGEVSNEDILAAKMAGRADDKGITYVAFTATPKAKTMELFGRKGDDGLPTPFHVYSMRQAIEEGFILDVLKNYTPYKLAFRLAHDGRDWDDTEVEKSTANKAIMKWVQLHPWNISQKVQIVVEHYRENVQPLLNGQGKAMVVLGSRVEAVRWQLAIQKYIAEKGYALGTLVAFSGEVNDKTSGPDPFTETSATMNPGLKGRDIRDAFAGPDYQLLLVANKFQTGFDQPLLCGMYVDRRLAGIQAVQTLSRLNRAHPGKDTTYILDFVNSSEEVLTAFKMYFETAELEAATDPNLIFDLRAKLDAVGHYDDFDVDRVVRVELDPKATQGQLISALEPVADRVLKAYSGAKQALVTAKATGNAKAESDARDHMSALELFKGDMGAYLRLYSFLSQIIDYGNTEVEKRAIFYRRLLPLLEFGREREGVDLSGIKLTHHTLKNEGKRDLVYGVGETPKLPGVSEVGSGGIHEKEKALLDEIIARVNDLFGADTTDNDQLVYVNQVLKGKLLESDELAQQAANNTKAQFASSPTLGKELLDAIMDALAAHNSLSKQALESQKIQEGLKDALLGPGQLYEALRARASIPTDDL